MSDEPQYRADYDGFLWQLYYWPVPDAPGFCEKIAEGAAGRTESAMAAVRAAMEADVAKRKRSFFKTYNAAGEEVTQ